MNTVLLGGLTFVLVFAGIILLHEIGHFTACRLLGIDAQEFGIFLPPRLLRLWRGKGKMRIGEDTVQIPRNFDLPFDDQVAVRRNVVATVDRVKDRLVLRTIELPNGEEQPDSPPAHDTVDIPPRTSSKITVRKPVPPGAIRLEGIAREIHPGTEYTLNWIPLGGFVRPKGEDDPTIPGGLASAKPWQRIVMLLAGATMNLLTAVVVYAFLLNQVGVPDKVIVEEVSPATPAAAAGLLPGDLIVRAGDEEIHSIYALQMYTQEYAGQEIQLTVQRGGEEVIVPIVPRLQPPEGQGRLGILTGQEPRPMKNIFETLGYSFQATYQSVRELLALPVRLIAGTLSPEEAQLAGPRSIWNLFQQSVERDVESRTPVETSASTGPTYYTLLIIINLTITVGVANLLPIPALDGGRIFFALIELIFRRRVPPRLEATVHGVGFLIAIGLMLYVYIADIIHPISIILP
jgi:regulator of sigma E protease